MTNTQKTIWKMDTGAIISTDGIAFIVDFDGRACTVKPTTPQGVQRTIDALNGGDDPISRYWTDAMGNCMNDVLNGWKC